MGETTANITEFEGLANFESLPLAQFLEHINNKKDI
jgi:hypothetical protein